MGEQKLTLENLAVQMQDRMTLYERNLAALSARIPEKREVPVIQMMNQRRGHAEEATTVKTIAIGEPSDLGTPNTAFSLVEIEYSTSTHVLRYRVRQPQVDPAGNLTFGSWGSYTTIATAVSA